MKPKQTTQTNLFAGGKAKLEQTNEFQKKVAEIKAELTAKYALPIQNEKNWLKRLFLKFRLRMEIRERIEELSSFKNLHVIKPHASSNKILVVNHY